MTITIRPVAVGHLPGVGRVHQRARNARYAGIVPAEALAAGGPEAMAAWWRERWAYEHLTHRMAVATDPAGRVVGFTYVGPSETPGASELYAIHVDPDRQGEGVGRALMRHALDALTGFGEPRAVLWVLVDNTAARRFYERGGWLAEGVERDSAIGPSLVRQARYGRPLPPVGARPGENT